MNTQKWIIRTHDRMAFKRCRNAWNYGSKLRENWEANDEPEYFAFGSDIHVGIDSFYQPETWQSDMKLPLAISSFLGAWDARRARYNALGDLASWEDQRFLGVEMLKNYANWSKKGDGGLTPVASELEFELPIPIRNYGELPPNFRVGDSHETFRYSGSNWGNLYYKDLPVYYQGKLDRVFRNEIGELFLDDTKTAGRFDEILPFLEFDEQLGSYAWALRELGQPVKGIFYTQLHKSYPQLPELLKNGKALSKNKSQNTTVELYLKAIQDYGFNPEAYADFLLHLTMNPNQSIRRTMVQRTDTELDNLGNQIALEAIDMLNNPHIYRNPTPGWSGCDHCQFRVPCLADGDGSGSSYYLEDQFHKRESNS